MSTLYIWNRTYVHFLRHVPSVLPVVPVGGGTDTTNIKKAFLSVCCGNIYFHESSVVSVIKIVSSVKMP